MGGYFLRSKLTFWVMLALLLAVGGILLSHIPFLAPFERGIMKGIEPLQRAANHIANPIESFFETLARARDLKTESEKQQEEIERLTQEVVRLRELEFENRRLQTLLNYQMENPVYEFLSATIIARDPSNLLQRIIIDKGIEDGVKEGMVVVADGGLAGKVIKSYATSAKVLLITDPSSVVNAMIQNSHALGVVRGKPASSLMMEFISQNKGVVVGDFVITSGLGGGYPKGLLIGRVVEISGDDMDPFFELRLEPAVQLNRLEDVIIITNFLPISLE